ncbi:hypothetical protein GH714_009654 [Hevea brasiliensis]|uniref:Uncharacterized protein n=1 Tax=Hevea brasiliensis TaxID=3981 RepID=A0A6A6MYW6_HEVBR|nr:hypothetical protein GH714_009654 [Hevea brasiliensis]
MFMFIETWKKEFDQYEKNSINMKSAIEKEYGKGYLLVLKVNIRTTVSSLLFLHFLYQWYLTSDFGMLQDSRSCCVIAANAGSAWTPIVGKEQESHNVLASERMAPRGHLVFSVAIGALIFVPVFKALTGLPPYMGMLLGLGVLWIVTDAIPLGESERQRLKLRSTTGFIWD